MNEDTNFLKIAMWFGAFIGVIILIGLVNPFVVVGAGERGVVMNFGSVQNNVLGEGMHFRIPFMQSIRKVNVRVQKQDVQSGSASKDLQDVVMDVVVNYHIDPARVNTVYQNIGDNEDVVDRIINPNTSEVVKASTAQFTAEEIIQKRQELKVQIDKGLAERLNEYGVILDDVSLVNIDFSNEFNAAIEAKQVAEQNAKRAEFTALQAEKDAEAAVNKAKGEAEAQRLQQQTLSPALLQKLWIEKWKGDVPQVVTDGNNLFFQIPSN